MWQVHELHLCHFLQMFHICGKWKSTSSAFLNLSGVWYVNYHLQINYYTHLQLKFVTNLTLKRLWINVDYTKSWLSTWNTKVGLGTLRKKNSYEPKRWPHSFETHTNMFVVALSNVKNSLSYFVYITHVQLFPQHQNTNNEENT